uniref:Uncharacterized protein n=1 Tax=Anopheles minimus TaxID=112268 RepID=A0A182WG65_9DIPT
MSDYNSKVQSCHTHRKDVGECPASEFALKIPLKKPHFHPTKNTCWRVSVCFRVPPRAKLPFPFAFCCGGILMPPGKRYRNVRAFLVFSWEALRNRSENKGVFFFCRNQECRENATELNFFFAN